MKRNYVNRDYAGYVSELTAHIRETRPDLFSDFSDASLGQLLIEMISFVGDTSSYGQDSALLEVFLSTCLRYESALYWANSLGYVPRPYTAASAILKSQDVSTALTTYGGRIPAGSTVRGDNGLQYQTTVDTVVTSGQSVIRLAVTEGAAYTETFTLTNIKNQTITTANPRVADKSWVLFVGDSTVPSNEWVPVDNVLLETTASNVFDVSFDSAGKLIVRFGDGNAGQIPVGVVTLTYRSCNGLSGNCPANSIKGALRATVASPGTGVVAVQFTNYDVQSAVAGTTQIQSGEVLPTSLGSPTYNTTLANTPLVSTTVQVTFLVPGVGVLIIQDNGSGGWTVTSNTSGLATSPTTHTPLASGTITYSTAAINLTFYASLPAGVTVTADYQFFSASNPSQVSIIGAATGGSDRESLAELKANIPAFVRSQDRLMTADDYAAGLKRLPGCAVAYVDNWPTSFSGNIVRLYMWGQEGSVLPGLGSDGSVVSVPYTRYTQAPVSLTTDAQVFLKGRTSLTVHHVMYRPAMLWLDVYLGNVTYDKRYALANVRTNILAAMATVAEQSSGFEIRLANIVEAVRLVPGVLYFQILRLVTGRRDTSTTPEAQGATVASAVVSGTLNDVAQYNQSSTTCCVEPGSVAVTVNQGSVEIVCQDNAAGHFTLTSGSVSILSSSIDYVTGAWTITFDATLLANCPYYATYRDTHVDMRASQNVIPGDLTFNDKWPPPGVGNAPFHDGVPLTSDSGVNRYARLDDVVIAQTVGNVHLYDDTFIYNNTIVYQSVATDVTDIRCINLRRAVFDLIPA